jgi:hypothetical protein
MSKKKKIRKVIVCNKSGIVLVSLRMSYPGKSNQVPATEQELYLLVYIDEI